jgi:DnaK suppressor protein
MPPKKKPEKKNRDEELLELKEILLEEKRKIIHQLYNVQEEAYQQLSSDFSGDSADVASIEISLNSGSKLGGRQQKLLNKINHALKKFEDGTYGICELTGEEIPVARLRARPVAQYTVEAKEELERKEKFYRDRSSDDDEDFSIEGDSLEIPDTKFDE